MAAPARRRWLRLVLAVGVLAAGVRLATRDPSSEVPLADDAEPECARDDAPPSFPVLRSTRRETFALEERAKPIEEWFALHGVGGRRRQSATFEWPEIPHPRAAEVLSLARLVTSAPDPGPANATILLGALLRSQSEVAASNATLRMVTNFEQLNLVQGEVGTLNSGAEGLRTLVILRSTLTPEQVEAGMTYRVAITHSLTASRIHLERSEPGDGLERRTFDARPLGVRVPDDEEPSEDDAPRITPPPFLRDDELAEMVKSSVHPASWEAAGASAVVANGELVARNTPEVLDAVGTFLSGLRERLAPKIAERDRSFARTHRAFDVSDLLDGEGSGHLAPEGLRSVVTSRVDPASWLAEGRVDLRDGVLVVRNSPENLDAVERLLARLREALHRKTEPRADEDAPR